MGSVGKLSDIRFPTNFSYGDENNVDFEVTNKLYASDWKNANDKYAEYLASSFYERADGNLYVYEDGKGNRAFIHLTENNTYLDGLGSTGGGAGTEMFIRLLEVQAGNNRSLSWKTDNADSARYYDHLGLTKYGKENGWVKGSKSYTIPANEMAKIARKLRQSNKSKNK